METINKSPVAERSATTRQESNTLALQALIYEYLEDPKTFHPLRRTPSYFNTVLSKSELETRRNISDYGLKVLCPELFDQGTKNLSSLQTALMSASSRTEIVRSNWENTRIAFHNVLIPTSNRESGHLCMAEHTITILKICRRQQFQQSLATFKHDHVTVPTTTIEPYDDGWVAELTFPGSGLAGKHLTIRWKGNMGRRSDQTDISYADQLGVGCKIAMSVKKHGREFSGVQQSLEGHNFDEVYTSGNLIGFRLDYPEGSGNELVFSLPAVITIPKFLPKK